MINIFWKTNEWRELILKLNIRKRKVMLDNHSAGKPLIIGNLTLGRAEAYMYIGKQMLQTQPTNKESKERNGMGLQYFRCTFLHQKQQQRVTSSELEELGSPFTVSPLQTHRTKTLGSLKISKKRLKSVQGGMGKKDIGYDREKRETNNVD